MLHKIAALRDLCENIDEISVHVCPVEPQAKVGARDALEEGLLSDNLRACDPRPRARRRRGRRPPALRARAFLMTLALSIVFIA